MRQMAFFLFSFFVFLSTPLWAGYSLSDLEILGREENYEEFFKHALDIRPSERLDSWKNMVSKMAEGYSKSLLRRSEITKDQFLHIEDLYQWPQLRKDDVFKLRRQEIGLRYLRKCLKKEGPCWKEVKNFWEVDPQNPEISFKIAEMIDQEKESPLKLWTFLDVALKDGLSEFYCKRDFVMDALWKKFEIDYIRLGSKGDFLKKIDGTVHPDCLPALNKVAKARLLSPDRPEDRELSYQILKAQGKIDATMADFFLTVYLMEEPSQGELFNYAWNRLRSLSKSSKRRDEVLKIVKKLDPLPDALLGSMDEKKKRVILSHFKHHFPEYLDYYTEQCLYFYEGTKIFPNGNPTINCQYLMKQESASTLVGADKLKRFELSRKI